MKKFVTAYDVAWQEFLAGRMDKNKLPEVLSRIMTEKNFRTTIPNFSYCPTSGHIWNQGDFPKEKELLTYARFIMKKCSEKKRRRNRGQCK